MALSPIPARIRLQLASPETIRGWSHGEVCAARTLHYLTLKPEREGLHSEQIFGPVVSWSCACGRYQRTQRPGTRCEVCGVELAEHTVRRARMGHIELAVPIAHPWFAKHTPNVLALLLDMPPRLLHALLAYHVWVVLSLDEVRRQWYVSRQPTMEPEATLLKRLRSLQVGALLKAGDAFALSQRYGDAFHAESGAGAIRALLARLDLEALARRLRIICTQEGIRAQQAHRRLEVVDALRAGGTDPTWMILSVLPVLPPDLRPVVPLDGGRMVSSDLNALYERVLHRNQRIAQLRAAQAPQAMLMHEYRLLQDACDAVLDNGHRTTPALGPQGVPLKSLTERLSGKHGRLRAQLLGKRVDYSGRSVIVGNPTLKLHQCGLPTSLCLELFKPFLMRRLVERGVVSSPRAAKRLIERPRMHTPLLWDLLAEVMYERVVMSERALRRCLVLYGASGQTHLVDQVSHAYTRQMRGISGKVWKPSAETLSDLEAAKRQTGAYRFPKQAFPRELLIEEPA